MSFVQILSAFRLYGADVLLLALGVTLTVSLLKKTVFKRLPKKVFVFLPFLVGLVFYAGFRAIVTLSADPFTRDLAHTLEGGFACGCAATLYYVIYEQFIRGRSLSPLYPLLEGIVPQEAREEAAKSLYEGSENMTETERVEYFKTHLNTFADPPMSEEELAETALLLAKFLSSLERK